LNLSRTSIILVRPQLPENIGMVARSMDNFGLRNLILVNPRENWPNKKALDSAKHAKKIIRNVKIYNNLEEALNFFNLVVATTNRKRFLEKKQYNNFKDLKIKIKNEKKTAILFGPENSGLSNKDLRLVDFIFTIPTVSNNKSLNLSHAVSIVSFKLSENNLSKNMKLNSKLKKTYKANKKDLSNFMNFLLKQLDSSNFFYPKEKKQSMIDNIFSIYLKANLSKSELNMLWGMFKKLRK